jgi:hypothetical protein
VRASRAHSLALLLTAPARLETVDAVLEDEVVQVSLSASGTCRLADGLDAHEYWELGDVLPRNNGEVFIPGDLDPGPDRYWDGVVPTREQQEAIDEVRACRELRGPLVQMLGVLDQGSSAP